MRLAFPDVGIWILFQSHDQVTQIQKNSSCIMAQFYRLRHCNQRDKNIVNGYVKRMQKMFPTEENSHFIIDLLIQNLILLFFHKTMDSKILTDDEQSEFFQLLQENANDEFRKLLMIKRNL